MLQFHWRAAEGGAVLTGCDNPSGPVTVPETALGLSVVGIDDSYLSGVSKVPFTSFPHPKDMLGRKAAENLIAMIEHPEYDGGYLFDSDPVVRESVSVITEEGERRHA